MKLYGLASQSCGQNMTATLRDQTENQDIDKSDSVVANYTYSSNRSLAASALCEWHFEAQGACTTKVVPDGCRDFIIKQSDYHPRDWFISDLETSTYSVESQAQDRIVGIRLRPGTRIDVAQLTRWLPDRSVDELMGSDQLDEFCVQSDSLMEALACLSSEFPSVQSVAEELGVSIRTLQRFVKAETSLNPRFWHSLARIRRAGRSLPDYASLSDAAQGLGFSDQAHLTREMTRWFGVTPKQLKTNDELIALLREPGYG